MPSIVTQKDRMKEMEEAKAREKEKEKEGLKKDKGQEGDLERDGEKDVPEKEIEKEKEGERRRHKSSHKPSRSTQKSRKISTPPEQSATSGSSPTTSRRRASMPESNADQFASSASPHGSKNNLPYPSFSKSHSREAVGSRENITSPRLHCLTPDPTDIEQNKKTHSSSHEERRPRRANVAPPSPPETTVEEKIKMDSPKVEGPAKVERKLSDLQSKAEEWKRRLLRTTSSGEMSKDGKNESIKLKKSHRELSREERKSQPSSANSSKPTTPSKRFSRAIAVVDDSGAGSGGRKASPALEKSDIHTDSDATSVAPNQPTHSAPRLKPEVNRNSSSTIDTSEPKTPTYSFPHGVGNRQSAPSFSNSKTPLDGDQLLPSPMPPPPPPPPPLELLPPRVDYLMKNGGLPHEVSKSLLSAIQPQGNSAAANAVAQIFTPFNGLLDNYSSVMTSSGSLAVATGYRSVARRLLDRLETVFARDISSESCACVICLDDGPEDVTDKLGVSWGEILEFVSGRQELPQWPPFLLDTTAALHVSLPPGQAMPMQKMDIDVPEEFRAHYIRQSKKTKQSVDRWLDNQPANPTSPPQDVDDETLTFAMLTRLEPHQRTMFKSLLGVTPSRPASAAVPGATSSLLTPDSEPLRRTGLAIQRLYRLNKAPRDPESAMYLLQNPQVHNVLATLAAISDHEWDVLTSGRFDGFLRSGADEVTTRAPSRGPTPAARNTNNLASPSNPFTPPQQRGTTPFQSSPGAVGAPVALDEETEIATLAEVEREIYLGMEALEDAFEALHQKAETVRSALRQRGAGLAQANQRRRCGSVSSTATLDNTIRFGTPGVTFTGPQHGLEESDLAALNNDDADWAPASELAPDDSASNVSRSRHRRPKRRTERRTPAPVEEEDEEHPRR